MICYNKFRDYFDRWRKDSPESNCTYMSFIYFIYFNFALHFFGFVFSMLFWCLTFLTIGYFLVRTVSFLLSFAFLCFFLFEDLFFHAMLIYKQWFLSGPSPIIGYACHSLIYYQNNSFDLFKYDSFHVGVPCPCISSWPKSSIVKHCKILKGSMNLSFKY